MRVAIVNDMTMALETLRRVILQIPGCSVPWVAHNGAEAVTQCLRNKPDLILMDLFMPVMDGVAATRHIMTKTPCPILIVTAMMDGHAAKVLEALGAGALDAIETPVFAMYGQPAGADRLKIRIESIRRLISEGDGSRVSSINSHPSGPFLGDPLIVIGSSAGGPSALATIFRSLPQDLSAAIVVVQHIDAQFAAPMASWLDKQTPMRVRTAELRDRPETGTILIAATNDHLIFVDSQNLGYTPEPRESYYRPSVDVFFASVASCWKGAVMAVLLTGMGRDGAKGLKTLRESGAMTVAQDSQSCVVYGMPKAAVELNAATDVLPLDRIAESITNFLKARKQGTYA